MNAVIRLIFTLICAISLCSCADSVNEGVLIVPSSQNGGFVSEPVLSETEDSAETDVIASEPEASLESSAVEDVVPDDTMDVIAQARLLLEDAQFCRLFAQYDEQISAEDPLAAVAAVLAYQKLHGETVTPQSPDALDGDVVYWTGGGSVWHVTKACTALAKSKLILSGSETAAQQAGKTRVCKRCGE